MTSREYTSPDLDVSIKDLTIQDKVDYIHPNLPSVPLNMCVYGSSSSGKTNMLLNLIGFYKKQFKKRVMVFTKTLNGSLMSLEKSIGASVFNNIVSDQGIDRIRKILDFQKKAKEKGDPLKHVLILFDDFICDNSLNKKRGIYEELFSTARHYNISIIITSQQYTLLPSSIRRLSWHDCLFAMSNSAERKMMVNECCGSLYQNESEFESNYNEATREKYSFMYINRRDRTFSTKFGA